MLLSHQHLTLQDSETVARRWPAFAEQPAVGFSDCLVLEVARKPVTCPSPFDRDFSKLPVSRL